MTHAPALAVQSTVPFAVLIAACTMNRSENAPVASVDGNTACPVSQSAIEIAPALHGADPRLIDGSNPLPATVTVWPLCSSVDGVTVRLEAAPAGAAMTRP